MSHWIIFVKHENIFSFTPISQPWQYLRSWWHYSRTLKMRSSYIFSTIVLVAWRRREPRPQQPRQCAISPERLRFQEQKGKKSRPTATSVHMESLACDPFPWLNLIRALISNFMSSKVRDEVTYPFPQFVMELIRYSYWDLSWTMFVKGAICL